MLTTRMYMTMVASVSAAAVLSAATIAIFRSHAEKTPARPGHVAQTAVWRPTPSDSVALSPHGDWISCSGAGTLTHCVLTDANGSKEYEGTFETLPEVAPLSSDQLHPVTSEDYSPWMWSSHENRMVPVIPLENGAVLAPKESAADLRGYVARIRKFTERLRPVPVYAAEAQPRASEPSETGR